MFQIVAPPKYINERYNVIFDKSINDSNFREGDQIFSMPKEKLDSYIIDRNPIIESYICNGTNQKDFAEKLSGGIMPPECRTASEIVENGFKF